MGPNSRPRRAAAAAVSIAALLAFVSGCGGQDLESRGPSASSVPSTSSSEAGPAGPSITGGAIVKTDKGEYLQSTITADDPAMKYDPSKNLGNPEDHVSREQLEKAQQFSSRFIAEEVIDSPLNNSAVSVDAWWSEHQVLFDPAHHEATRKSFDADDGPVMRNLWQNEITSFDYDFVYSPTETRFSERGIDVKEIYYSDKNEIVITTDFSYTAKVQTPEGIDAEQLNGTYVMGLVPTDQNASGWMIRSSRWTSSTTEIPASANAERGKSS